ncbi:MAG: hypothetical protein EOR86_13390 [Mesorhizobium sp.]|uniref:hypothetical protein n=1 Tax=Mesorhizobium sp. TaxID=1871066 RepID=UPI000FE5160B|nr:hypothetical protein [Mesorhizobium sp.]RWM96197.1 MAG: hypothetical protein EOR86_13390 [Mesorhizobium sp.]
MATTKTVELAEQFNVRDSSGRANRVNVWQTILRTRMLDGSISVAKGLADLKLSDGTELNYIDDDTVQAVMTGEIYKRA